MVYLNYKEIRSKYQNKTWFLCDRYALIISPFITKEMLRMKLRPNIVTLLMMISGIIGAIMFSFDNLALRILGIVFIHLWYVLDCSDGEVARITKIFSRMGKEIDYTAHIINHPYF